MLQAQIVSAARARLVLYSFRSSTDRFYVASYKTLAISDGDFKF